MIYSDFLKIFFFCFAHFSLFSFVSLLFFFININLPICVLVCLGAYCYVPWMFALHCAE